MVVKASKSATVGVSIVKVFDVLVTKPESSVTSATPAWLAEISMTQDQTINDSFQQMLAL